MTSARSGAVATIGRVMDEGAYSNVLVPRTTIDPDRERSFFERLTYTTLRWLPGIDRSLASVSTRSLDDLDRGVRAILRVAAAELLHLDGAPHAIVNEYVEISKTGRASRASGFINAVLRALVEQPRSSEDLSDAYPAWLIDAVRRDLDTEPGDRFLFASNGPAPIGVRHRPEVAATYLPQGQSPPTASASVDIIDPASAAVAVAAAIQPGMRVLDMSAAPGGKARALADAAGPSGLVVASDVHDRRVRSAARRPNAPAGMQWMVADGRTAPFAPDTFDRVVLDAPCSGLGTLRRRPEIRYRVDPDSVGRLSALQNELLDSAMNLVRPGGRIVYSVCTVLRSETIDVVAGRGFAPPSEIDGQAFGDGVLLGPHIGGTDGMFIAVRDA